MEEITELQPMSEALTDIVEHAEHTRSALEMIKSGIAGLLLRSNVADDEAAYSAISSLDAILDSMATEIDMLDEAVDMAIYEEGGPEELPEEDEEADS